MDQVLSYVKNFVESLKSSNKIPRDVEMAFRERLGLNTTSSSGSVPSGALTAYAANSAPSGWLMCDGSAVSRTQYATLFAVIGTLYGSGDGSTTFNLPDLRTRVIAGYKSGDSNFGTFAGTLGESSHTLTINEMPNHDHGIGNNVTLRGAGTNVGFGPSSANQSFTFVAQGGDQAHNNIQPSIAMSYIIKT